MVFLFEKCHFLEMFILHPLQLIVVQLKHSMPIIDQRKLQAFVSQHGINNQFETFLRVWPLASHLKLHAMNPSKISQFCIKINSNDFKAPKEKASQPSTPFSWKNGELKLFFWVLIFYCYVQTIEVKFLGQKDYYFFQEIFTKQSIHHLRYQVYCSCPPHGSVKRIWGDDETQLLSRIVKTRTEGSRMTEWKQVAFDLFNLSEERYFRTNAQCRQRWINHLDPSVSRQRWNREEDFILMSMIQNGGAGWANIAKEFDGSRTEHMVKNRYHSLIQKWKRGNSRWTNKQIQKKIIDSLQKGFEKTNTPIPKIRSQLKQSRKLGEIEVKEDTIVEQEKEEVHDVEVFAIDFTSEVSIKQAEKFSETNHTQGELIQIYKKLRQFDDQKTYERFGCLKCSQFGVSYYRDKQIRLAIDDVAQKLGCHAQQFDMLYNEQDPQWGLENEE